MDIKIDYNKCSHLDCLDCLDICPMDVFDFKNNALIISKLDNCCGCRACVDVCFKQAIAIDF